MRLRDRTLVTAVNATELGSCTASARLEKEGQACWTMHVQSFTRLPGRIAGKFEVTDSIQKFGERDSCFQTCQRGAEAEVNAVSEGNVRVGIARDIEMICLGKLLGVSIRRTQDREDHFPGGD